MLRIASTYEKTVSGFSWDMPQSYNIAVDCCDKWADNEPDRAALIIEGLNGSTVWSYAHLQTSTNRIANTLRASRVREGDRVAILLPQSADVAIAHLAIYKLGAIAVPLAALFGVEALHYRLTDSGASALFTDASGVEKLADLPDDSLKAMSVFSIDGAIDGAVDLWAAAERASDQFEAVATTPDTPALMIYTSGTTGPPKGALHGHRVLLGHLPGVQFPHEGFPQVGDRMWTPADWAWAGGLLNVLLPSLRFGIPVVGHAYTKFDPEEAFDLMARHRIRNSFIPPTALKMLRAVERPAERFDLNLRTIGSGGEALGRETFEWAQEVLGVTVNEFYGQTECNLVLSSCASISVSKPGAIGKPVPGHQVSVIDDDGNPLEAGVPGQIAIKAPDPVMFLSYWQNEAATRAKYIGDWLTTGDQGIIDDEGYFTFFGRNDDVITSSGYRIGPGEIEDCLLGHPAVALAAVIGKPDPIRTEIIKAFIVTGPSVTVSQSLTEDIQSFVRNRLSAHEYPREIAYVDSLPLTTTGKIIRRALRDIE